MIMGWKKKNPGASLLTEPTPGFPQLYQPIFRFLGEESSPGICRRLLVKRPC